MGLERNVSYAYVPYNSFYYGDYISSLPYAYIPQNYKVQMEADERGRGHHFHGSKNMRMHFQDRTIKRKSLLHLMMDQI